MSEKNLLPCPFSPGRTCADCPIILTQTVETKKQGEKKPKVEIVTMCPMKHAALSLSTIAEKISRITQLVEAVILEGERKQ